MKIRKLAHLGSALIVSLSSLFFINFGTAFAAANNCTWTGANSNNFNDAGNWSSCNSTVPQTGDNLVFDNTSLGADATINNDMTGLSVGSITFSGSGTSSYTLSGNNITIASGISNTTTGCFNSAGCFAYVNNGLVVSGAQTFSGNVGLELGGNLSGSGLITVTGSLILDGNNSAFSGGFTDSAGYLSGRTATALGTGTTTIADGGSLYFEFDSDTTVSTPLSLGGNGNGQDPAVYMTTSNYTGDGSTLTLSGPVTLTSNIQVGGFGERTMKITGPLSGNFAISPWEGDSNAIIDVVSSNNTSKTPSGVLPINIASTDSQSGLAFTAYTGIIYNLDGVRGDGTVMSGSTLKGTGTAGNLTVEKGGVLAPGHSPGCLSTKNLTINGTYQVELGGTTACSGYDQLKVTGTVDVTGATLDTILYNKYAPKAGSSYTIINNDGTDKVTGTFNGLAEGATFKVSGYVFKITYKGGTGNDVVLSVVSVPKTPDTGFGFSGASPTATLIGALATASVLALIGRRLQLAYARR